MMSNMWFLEIKKYVRLKGCEILCCLLLTLLIAGAGGTKCYKNEAIGDRAGNVYYCDTEDMPECCEEEGEFACCEDQGTKTLREQLILWGSLAAIVLVITIVLCFFLKDIHCCKDDTPLKEKCCRCCRKKDDEKTLTSIPEIREDTSFNYQSRENTLENFNTSVYRASPIPTFNFKSPKY